MEEEVEVEVEEEEEEEENSRDKWVVSGRRDIMRRREVGFWTVVIGK